MAGFVGTGAVWKGAGGGIVGRVVCVERSDAVRAARRAVLRMATVYDASGHVYVSDSEDELENPLSHVNLAICEFMSRDHRADLLEYVAQFSDVLPDRSEVERVELFDIDQFGMNIEVTLCAINDERCVCLRPKILWRGSDKLVRQCDSVDEVLECLSAMSLSCGLPPP